MNDLASVLRLVQAIEAYRTVRPYRSIRAEEARTVASAWGGLTGNFVVSDRVSDAEAGLDDVRVVVSRYRDDPEMSSALGQLLQCAEIRLAEALHDAVWPDVQPDTVTVTQEVSQ